MIRKPRRWLGKAGVVWMLGAFSLLIGSGSASAHSYFMQSDPQDGSILERAPVRVVLAFSSAVATNFTSIQLVEAKTGVNYPPKSVLPYPSVPNIVVVILTSIPNGSYRLSFSTRDAVDFHETAGSIVFGVGEAPPAPTGHVPQPIPPKPAEFLLRWLGLAGLSAILGGITVALLVVGRLPVESPIRARIQRALLALALAGAATVLVAETALLALQASAFGPVLPSMGRMLSGSEYGTRWLVILLIVAGLTPLLAVLWRNSKRTEMPGLIQDVRRLRIWVLLTTQVRVVFLGLALTVAMALSGHVAGASGTSIGGVALLALHIGAMGVWAGGVVGLTLVLLTLRRATGSLDRATMMAMVVGFGPIAAVSFTTLGASGMLLAGTQVASLTALLSTQYGTVLIAKVALIGVVAQFGLRHALLTFRDLLPRFLIRFRLPIKLPVTIALEAGGAMVVVLFAAVLGSSAPAQGRQFDPPASGPSITQLTQEQDGLLITVSVKPNRPGPNLVSVRLVDTRRPVLYQVKAVTMAVRQPGDPGLGQPLPTTQSGKAYDAGTIQLAAGDVRFAVTIARPPLADTIANVSWRVDALDVPRVPVIISNERLAPTVDLIALLMVVMAATALGAAVAVRYRRARRLAAAAREADSALARRAVLAPVAVARHRSVSTSRSRRRVGVHLRARGKRPARRSGRSGE